MRLPSCDVIISSARMYVICERPSPPYSRGILMPNAPMSRNACTTDSGISPSRSISSESVADQDVAQLFQEFGRARCLVRIVLFGMRMNEVEPESAEEEFADETRMLPLCFARRFGGFASLTLGGEGLGW